MILGSEHHRAVEVPPALRAHNPALAIVSRSPVIIGPSSPTRWEGGYDATRRLLERENAAVGFINLSKKVPATAGRLKGYKAALREAGVAYDPGLVLNNESADAHEGYELTGRLLDRQPDLRLLFCGNDRTAMGAYQAI